MKHKQEPQAVILFQTFSLSLFTAVKIDTFSLNAKECKLIFFTLITQMYFDVKIQFFSYMLETHRRLEGEEE